MSVKSSIHYLYKNLLGSLDNKKNSGFSARKLTAFIGVACYVLIHLSWLKHAFLKEDYEYMIELVVVDALFILLSLGIVTLEQISRLKEGNRGNEKRKEGNENN